MSVGPRPKAAKFVPSEEMNSEWRASRLQFYRPTPVPAALALLGVLIGQVSVAAGLVLLTLALYLGLRTILRRARAMRKADMRLRAEREAFRKAQRGDQRDLPL
jgi:hypothetical protein